MLRKCYESADRVSAAIKSKMPNEFETRNVWNAAFILMTWELIIENARKKCRNMNANMPRITVRKYIRKCVSKCELWKRKTKEKKHAQWWMPQRQRKKRNPDFWRQTLYSLSPYTQHRLYATHMHLNNFINCLFRWRWLGRWRYFLVLCKADELNLNFLQASLRPVRVCIRRRCGHFHRVLYHFI